MSSPDLIVRVTAAHIAAGVKGNCRLCPITLALQEVTPYYWDADSFFLTAFDPATSNQAWAIPTPAAAVKFMRRFDWSRRPVAPSPPLPSRSPAGSEVRMSNLVLIPISFRDACQFIATRHRHHRPPQGHKFSLAATLNGQLVGVATVGRPVAKELDDGLTAEVTRLCTDGTPNACSFLYSRAKRAAQAMGYRRVRTSILAGEPGTSLIAAGFKHVGNTRGGSWSRPSRRREDKHPTCSKQNWQAPIPGRFAPAGGAR